MAENIVKELRTFLETEISSREDLIAALDKLSPEAKAYLTTSLDSKPSDFKQKPKERRSE